MNTDVLKDIAEKHHLSLKRDRCGDTIFPGASGHLFDGYADGKLGVYVNTEKPKAWTFARRKLEQAGFCIRQDGDFDGVPCSIRPTGNRRGWPSESRTQDYGEWQAHRHRHRLQQEQHSRIGDGGLLLRPDPEQKRGIRR